MKTVFADMRDYKKLTCQRAKDLLMGCQNREHCLWIKFIEDESLKKKREKKTKGKAKFHLSGAGHLSFSFSIKPMYSMYDA